MDMKKYRNDFKILGKKINDKPIIYFDSACVSLKPKQVIDSMVDYYDNYPGCGGRSVHKISTQVSIKCDEAREKIKRFIGAGSEKEIVFTKNTTEGLNLIARGFGLKKGDTVLTTDKEHNSNLVPWHDLKRTVGVNHSMVMSRPDGSFDIESFKKKINRNVKLVSVYHTSNLDGYTLPVKDIIDISHEFGAQVCLDGAQSVPHIPVDVGQIDADYMAFSLHKMCGPSGVGVLYGKEDLLAKIDPFIVGGESVVNTTYESSVLLGSPFKFEGGLQNYAGIIGAGAAADYLSRIGMGNIEQHEKTLNTKFTESIRDMDELKIIGPIDPVLRGGITSFNIQNLQPHDIAMILDESANIMVRSGMLCVHSWFNAHQIKGCVRVSFYLYNTENEIDALIANLNKLVKEFCKK